MSTELRSKLEKQAIRIELLEEELRNANQALEEKAELAAGLEQDLEHALLQLALKASVGISATV